MNIVIRECDKCGYYEDDAKSFTYLRDSIWVCWKCGSKHTHIREIIEPDFTVDHS